VELKDMIFLYSYKILNHQAPTLSQLREKFCELARGELHLGLDPQAPSIEDPNITVEMERYCLYYV
jgi:hypothetical protein